MEQMAPTLDAAGMLDVVLAVFGAAIFALWRGRGKTVGGLLTGALVGGLIKPAFLVIAGSGLIFAAAGGMPEIRQTPEEQQKTLEFWAK